MCVLSAMSNNNMFSVFILSPPEDDDDDKDELFIFCRRHLILSCQGNLAIFPFDDPVCTFAIESSKCHAAFYIL